MSTQTTRSLAALARDADEGEIRALIQSMSPEEQMAALYDWTQWRRAEQTPPDGAWRVWLILAGRGFGKTRTGAEFIRAEVDAGRASRIALVGRTAADVRDTMIEGESGLLSVYPADQRPRYEPSKRRVTFHNGAVAVTYSADKPDLLRGPNHDLAWADELAAWRYADAWDQLMFGLRIGDHPRVVVTTTPRPIPLIRNLVKRTDGSVRVVTGSTYDNMANLSPDFITEMRRRYENSRLGRQELYAEILDDVDGALWDRDQIDAARVTDIPSLRKIVVAVDPAVTSSEDSNETGIIVAGADTQGHGYVLDDRSLKASPGDWAAAAIAAYHTHRADSIVAEANQGGDMVRHLLATVDSRVPVRLVRASRGKRTRAEPVAALYEQGRCHHVGMLSTLEDQLCSWVPDVSGSPDRLDALVWAFTDLLIDGARTPAPVVPASLEQTSPWRI
jgi:phage terminase large subunit-like protein